MILTDGFAPFLDESADRTNEGLRSITLQMIEDSINFVTSVASFNLAKIFAGYRDSDSLNDRMANRSKSCSVTEKQI